MRTASLPLADPAPLWEFRNRTRFLRIALALALLGVGVASILLARGTPATTTPLLSSNSRGIIVLDLSASIEDATLHDMYTSLSRLAASRGHYGLVIFSDQAYEALPPGTPSAELRPYAAFFQTRPAYTDIPPGISSGPGGSYESVYPTNPWASGFSLGTQISEGLNLARSIILSSHLEQRAVWLISDLGDEGSDFPLVRASARQYAQSHIALHVIALDPLKQDARFFESLHLAGGGATTGSSRASTSHAGGHPFPVSLAIVGIVLAGLLAINELWSKPFDWGSKV